MLRRENGEAADKLEQEIATNMKYNWVASHRCHCHQPEARKVQVYDCVTALPENNSNHIIWEPEWANRLRDNCIGLIKCKACNSTFLEVACPKCNTPISSCNHTPRCLYPHKANFNKKKSVIQKKIESKHGEDEVNDEEEEEECESD